MYSRFRTPLLRSACLIASLFAALLPAARAEIALPRPMEIEDLFRFHRVSDPQISPDGRWIAYVITDVDKAANRTNSDIWLIAADGSGSPRRLTSSPRSDEHPRWSPDGRWIAFESARGGESQVYLLPVDGGEPRQLTSLSTGASQPVWSPDGRTIAFVSAVYPEFSGKPFAESDRLNREKQEARDKSQVKVRVFEHLLYRHWASWVDDKRQHLFVIGVNPDGSAAGEPRDVTPGENDGVPTSDTFSAGDDFTFSPDGTELVTTKPPLPIREQAWSTNYDLWSVNLTTGEQRDITAQNPAADSFPHFSPDGKYLAYRAQRTPGFESDRWEIWLLDRATGERRSLTPNWDHWAGAFVWAPDGKSLYVESEDKALEPIFSVSIETGAVTPVAIGGGNTAVSVARDGRWIAFLHEQFTQPPEIARLDLGQREARPVTRANAALLAQIASTPPESVTVAGAGGTPIQMWIIKPPHFDPAAKYPLVYWVHGGPQNAWDDGWSYRWNPELWAAQGYVLALPNPRGSTGFGQEFTNEISRDWGGKVFDDLMACLAFMKQQPYIDSSRMAAAGASYGGYMMNWFEGHVQDFRTIVCHDGVYNFDSMYGTTDELWFDEHEHGIPWVTPDFDKYSPHRYAANWKTPMLIIQSALDFRCPIGQGMSAFTTLQRKGIPSKFISFPDEGHWVLKPQNSEFWHHTVFAWLADYLKPTP